MIDEHRAHEHERVYANTGACEGCHNTGVPGGLVVEAGVLPGVDRVERCDVCQRIPSDVEAAYTLARHVQGTAVFLPDWDVDHEDQGKGYGAVGVLKRGAAMPAQARPLSDRVPDPTPATPAMLPPDPGARTVCPKTNKPHRLHPWMMDVPAGGQEQPMPAGRLTVEAVCPDCGLLGRLVLDSRFMSWHEPAPDATQLEATRAQS